MNAIAVSTLAVVAIGVVCAASLFGAGIATGWILSHRNSIPPAHRDRLLGR